MSKIRFSISIKIHQNTQKVHSKSKHPVTITIKNSIQIHQSFFGGKKLDGSGLTSKAPCQSFADFLKDLALVRRQMQDVPWQNMCWDGLVTYRGEVSHQSSVCVCVCFFSGGTLAYIDLYSIGNVFKDVVRRCFGFQADARVI